MLAFPPPTKTQYARAHPSSQRKVAGPESAIYSGVRILFGIAPHSHDGCRRFDEQQQVHQWFGEGAYTFTATYGTDEGEQR
jgi:hypothetical protein